MTRPWQAVAAADLFAAEHHRALGEGRPRDEGLPLDVPHGNARTQLLDDRAVAEFRRRLNEIAAQLECAEQNNDLGARAALVQEREWLLSELRRARREGRASRETERARQAVGKAIQRAIQTLTRRCRPLGQHLRATVHCGLHCSYRPPPESSIDWTVVLP